jgi:hypothetical protein
MRIEKMVATRQWWGVEEIRGETEFSGYRGKGPSSLIRITLQIRNASSAVTSGKRASSYVLLNKTVQILYIDENNGCNIYTKVIYFISKFVT